METFKVGGVIRETNGYWRATITDLCDQDGEIELVSAMGHHSYLAPNELVRKLGAKELAYDPPVECDPLQLRARIKKHTGEYFTVTVIDEVADRLVAVSEKSGEQIETTISGTRSAHTWASITIECPLPRPVELALSRMRDHELVVNVEPPYLRSDGRYETTAMIKRTSRSFPVDYVIAPDGRIAQVHPSQLAAIVFT